MGNREEKKKTALVKGTDCGLSFGTGLSRELLRLSPDRATDRPKEVLNSEEKRREASLAWEMGTWTQYERGGRFPLLRE